MRVVGLLLFLVLGGINIRPVRSQVALASVEPGTYQTACKLIKAAYALAPPDLIGHTLHNVKALELDADGRARRLVVRIYADDNECRPAALYTTVTTAVDSVTSHVGTTMTKLDVKVAQYTATVHQEKARAMLALWCAKSAKWKVGEAVPIVQACNLAGLPGPDTCATLYTAMLYLKKERKLLLAEFYQKGRGTSGPFCRQADRDDNVDAEYPFVWVAAPGKQPDGNVVIDEPHTEPTPDPIPPDVECAYLPADTYDCAAFLDYQVEAWNIGKDDNGQPYEQKPSETGARGQAWDVGFAKLLPYINAMISHSPCRIAMASFLCSHSFPRCDKLRGLSVLCSPACERVEKYCTGADGELLANIKQMVGFDYKALCGPRCREPASDLLVALPPTADDRTRQLQANVEVHVSSVFSPRCLDYSGDVCRGVVNYPVFVPPRVTIAELEIVAHDRYWYLFGLAPRPHGCQAAIARLVCSSVFQRCDPDAFRVFAREHMNGAELALAPPLPCFPCRDVCEALHRDCGRILAKSEFPDCANKGLFVKDMPSFPAVTAEFSLMEGLVVSTQCNAMSGPDDPVVSVDCETRPLIFPKRPEQVNFRKTPFEGAACALECPFMVFSQPVVVEASRSARILIPLSFLGAIFVSWTIYSDKKRLSNQIQKYLLHCSIAVSLFYAPLFVYVLVPISGHDGQDKYGIFHHACKNNTEALSAHNSLPCLITGILTCFGMLSAVCWWSIYTLDIVLSVALVKRRMSYKQRLILQNAYYAFGYLPALAFVLVSTAMDAFGASTFVWWCWVSDQQLNNLLWNSITWLAGLDSLFLFYATYCLLTGARKANKTLRQRLGKYARPLCFIAFFLSLVTFLAVYRNILETRSDVFEGNIVSWISCKVLNKYGNIEKEACGDTPRGMPSGRLWVVSNVVISALGLAVFIMFGARKSSYLFWRRRMRVWISGVRVRLESVRRRVRGLTLVASVDSRGDLRVDDTARRMGPLVLARNKLKGLKLGGKDTKAAASSVDGGGGGDDDEDGGDDGPVTGRDSAASNVTTTTEGSGGDGDGDGEVPSYVAWARADFQRRGMRPRDRVVRASALDDGVEEDEYLKDDDMESTKGSVFAALKLYNMGYTRSGDAEGGGGGGGGAAGYEPPNVRTPGIISFARDADGHHSYLKSGRTAQRASSVLSIGMDDGQGGVNRYSRAESYDEYDAELELSARTNPFAAFASAKRLSEGTVRKTLNPHLQALQWRKEARAATVHDVNEIIEGAAQSDEVRFHSDTETTNAADAAGGGGGAGGGDGSVSASNKTTESGSLSKTMREAGLN